MQEQEGDAPCPRRVGQNDETEARHQNGLPGQARSLLGEPLDPSLVAEREGPRGRRLRYLEGWVAISQANHIFGFDGWGSELVGEVTYRPLFPDGLGMYTATVRLSVRGCPPHDDVGCGLVKEATADAHESAYKGAVTDAVKRALRHFGEQFGLYLYERQNGGEASSHHLSGARALESPEAQRARVFKLARRLGADAEQTRARLRQRYGRELEALTPDELAEVIGILADALNQRNGARDKAA